MKKRFPFFVFILTIFSMFLFLTGCDGAEEIKEIAQLSDKKIGVQSGNVADQMVLSRYPEAKINYYQNPLDGVQAVVDGKISAFAGDLLSLEVIAANNSEVTLLSQVFVPDDYGYAVQLDNTELKKAIDNTVSELKKNGTYDKMMQRWMPKNGQIGRMPEFEQSGTEGVLIFGTCSEQVPFSFYDEDRRIVGFDVEIAYHVAQSLNKKLEIVDMNFGSLITSLASGKVDMIGASISITEERAKKVLFSESYYTAGLGALVKNFSPVSEEPEKTETNQITEITQLADKKVGVQSGNVADQMVLSKYPEAKINYYQSPLDGVQAVIDGKISAFAGDLLSLEIIAANNSNVLLLPEVFIPDNYGYAVQLDNTELKKAIDDTVAGMKADGTYEKLLERWLPKNGKPGRMPEFDQSGTEGVLVFGTCSEQMPFSFYDEDRRIVGFDVEVAYHVAQRLNKKLEIVDMNFGSLITSLAAGKVDMIGASISITEERAKKVLFSESYYTAGLGALVKNYNSAAIENVEKEYFFVADLKNAKIGVMGGTIAEGYVEEHFPDAQMMIFSDIMDGIAALKVGRVDAIMTAYTTIVNAVKRNPDLKMLEENLTNGPACVAVSKGNSDLLEQISTLVKKYKEDGLLEDLEKRWLKLEDVPYEPLEINLPDTGEVLRVAISANREPIGFHGSNDEIKGFDPDFSRMLARDLGMQVEFIDVKFSALINLLESGKADVIISNMTATEERAKKVDFSESYFVNPQRMVVRRFESGDTTLMSVPDDIKDKKIGVLTGSVHDTYVMNKYPEAKIFNYKDISDLILSLKNDKTDVIMTINDTAIELFKTDDSLALLGGTIFSQDVGTIFNKKNADLREQFNKFLKQIKTDGVYDDMMNRWVADRKSEMPEIKSSGENGTLRVGIVSDKGLPFATMSDGEYIGFDVELCERFAAYLGKDIQFYDMQFGSLIPSVASDKIDIAASTLVITEERQKLVLFSDPYYELKSVFVANKKNLAGYSAAKVEEEEKTFFESVAESFYINIVHENRYILILNGLKVTLIIALLACLFGTILGSLVCYMRMSKNYILRFIAKLYITVLRGIPVLVLLMLIYYVVFASVNIDPVLVAIIAFGMNFGAYVSEMFRTSIERIDRGQTEAGLAGGFSKFQTFRYIILPQAVKNVIPVYKGEFISLVKMTSVVGYIAVQDLTKASDIIRSRTFDAFFPLIMVAILYFLLSWILTLALDLVEIRVDPKKRRKLSLKMKGGGKTRMIIALSVIIILIAAAMIVPSVMSGSKTALNKGAITDVTDLEGRKVIVITGTTGDFYVRDNFKTAEVIDMVYPSDAVVELQTKRGEVFLFDKNTLDFIIKSEKGLELLPGKISEVQVAIPIKGDNAALKQKVDECIETFREDGTLAEMYKRWFSDTWDVPPAMPKFQQKDESGVLRIGTCSMTIPFSFIHNRNLTGHDVELAYRIADRLGMKVEFFDLTFDAMITALQGGKIDMAISNYFYTEERERKVIFSIPYMTADVCGLVRSGE